MKKSRFAEEQIIGVLREQEAGARTEEVCHRHGIREQTFYHWKSKYGGMERPRQAGPPAPLRLQASLASGGAMN